MENKFYVYEHATEDGDVFYVGKGTADRAWAKTGRSRYWNNVARKHGRVVHIVRDGLSEPEAFEIEKRLIALHGRRDEGNGTLVNLTPGGEGKSGQTEKGKWAQILKDEGLGVICLDQEYRNLAYWAGSTETHTEASVYEPEHDCDDMWEAFTLAHRATPKEAEIADRRRGTVCGLDHEFRKVPLKPRRKHREPGKEWRARIQRHIVHTYA